MSNPSLSGVTGMPDEPVPVHLPSPAQLFETRASRFRELAPGHAIGGYLEFLSRLADGQARACREMPASPEGVPLAGQTPLSPGRWPRSAAWRHALDDILREMTGTTSPDQTADALARLAVMPDDAREALASAVLAGKPGEADLAPALFVGAALQVYWTTLAAMIGGGHVDVDDPTHGARSVGHHRWRASSGAITNCGT